jgi:hypothetical protein
MQAITLTEQLLRQHGSAQQPVQGEAGGETSAASPSGTAEIGRKRKSRFDSGLTINGSGSGTGTNSALPQQVIDQIRYAKARSALEGRAPAGWALGFECLARGPAGKWEAARVTAVTQLGNFRVEFEGNEGAIEEVHRADVKPRDSTVRIQCTALVHGTVHRISRTSPSASIRQRA